MEKKNSPINVMVDKETKEEATKILKEVGLSMSTAINLFLKQVINHNGLPFEVKKPNETLYEHLEQHKILLIILISIQLIIVGKN